jgi:hypothetical protein
MARLYAKLRIVGWVEQSETRHVLQMRGSGGFRYALPRRPHPPYGPLSHSIHPDDLREISHGAAVHEAQAAAI